MSALPRELQKVLNARAMDAWDAMNDAVECEDREAFERALEELHEVFRDEGTLTKEHTA